ncbi:MAG: alpha/beta hydrolase [Candidatus Latescibacterota bacterium]|jgi:pimeloyl-ACP methyl ester carboxylesterase
MKILLYIIALTLPRLAAAAPTITLKPCPSDIKVAGAECGHLEVYEDREGQQGRTIKLNIAVLPAFSRNPAPDPLFAFAGGPGMGSTELAGLANSALRRVRETRAIVLVDQRGTGDSGALDCEIANPDSALYLPDPVQWTIDHLRQCLNSYDADTRLYTTPIAMDDIDDVRQALGYDKINLWGGSYGTRAALIYMRRHPEHTRAVVLDGLAPPSIRLPLHMGPDAQRSLDLMWDACEADSDCTEAYGDIRGKFDSLLVRFKDPVEISFQHPRTGKTTQAPISRDGLSGLVRAALYSAEFTSLLPLVIDRAYSGDFAPLTALMEPWDEITNKMSHGMFYSVVCSEDVPFIKEEEKKQMLGTFFGPEAIDMMSEICGFWPQGELPANYHQPVSTDHPTLVLSGNFDPVTPPRWGEETARHLPNARHIVVPGVGHGTTSYGCVPKLIAQFIEEASVDSLDGECVNKLDRPPFFTSYTGYSKKAAQTEDAP